MVVFLHYSKCFQMMDFHLQCVCSTVKQIHPMIPRCFTTFVFTVLIKRHLAAESHTVSLNVSVSTLIYGKLPKATKVQKH